MSDESIVALNDIDHAIKRSAVYMGGTTTELLTDWFYDDQSGKMIKKELMTNSGLIKVIFEVIDNAVDNCSVTNNPTTNISVTMDATTITVKNNGASVPIEKKDIGNGVVQYIPTTLFSVFRSGRNFGDKRKGKIGMNGMGVKLTNVTSKKFSVTCYDGTHKFTQSWSNNMKTSGEPKVTKCAKVPPYTTIISFTPDMSFYKPGENGIKIESLDSIKEVIHTKLIHASITCKSPLKISFNGSVIKCKGLKNYMKLFTDDKMFYESANDDFEYGVALSTTGEYEFQSFVNSNRMTNQNSKEVKYVTSKIVNAVSSLLKGKKGTTTVKLTPSQISKHLFVFINTKLENPDFDAQTKTVLTSAIDPSIFNVDTKKIVNMMKKSGLIDKLESYLNEKEQKKLQTDLNGSKSNHVNVPKLEDALDAGTRKSGETMLFLVEGDSAKTMVVAGMTVIGRTSYGVFPLKGKLLNVIGASASKLMKNEEIKNIMKIIGLNFNKKYETIEERKTLRYGKVCILCDADHDGNHITGLLLTFFNHYWPALLTNDFVCRFITPIIKATKGKTQKKFFFTMNDYEKFAADNNGMSGWSVQHLKGLGTSLRTDTIGYFNAMKTFHLKKLLADDETKDIIDNIFNPSNSTWRKEWLLRPIDCDRLDYNNSAIDINKYLKTEMYDYSSYNIKRSIPSAIDGLKVSQRKILYSCFKKFPSESSPIIKVEQLASYVSENTNYAHGEVSLHNTITGMAQSFTGANNMPLLAEEGLFGSRLLNGGDAAAARYIFTKLVPEARHLFVDRSENVLEYQVEEGAVVEPTFYVPTLPLVLMNGSSGIATGFRSLLPCFNPNDILHNLKCKLGMENTPRKLLPWYGGGYKTNDNTYETDSSWVFEGQITMSNSGIIYVTELPIGISFEDYKTKVLENMLSKGDIKKYQCAHLSENDPKFIIHGYSGSTDNLIETFGLKNTMTKTCMNLLDENGIIRNFTSPEDIFDYWFGIRYKYVGKSHKESIRVVEDAIDELMVKYKFVKAIVDNDVEIRNRSSDMVVNDMMNKSVSNDREMIKRILHSMSLSSLTIEKYQDIKQQYENKKEQLELLKKMTNEDFIKEQLKVFEVKNNNKRKMQDSKNQSQNKRTNIY